MDQDTGDDSVRSGRDDNVVRGRFEQSEADRRRARARECACPEHIVVDDLELLYELPGHHSYEEASQLLSSELAELHTSLDRALEWVEGHWVVQVEDPCGACGGEGPCDTCDGAGVRVLEDAPLRWVELEGGCLWTRCWPAPSVDR